MSLGNMSVRRTLFTTGRVLWQKASTVQEGGNPGTNNNNNNNCSFNFEPSEEARAMIEVARTFTRDEIIPMAGELDKSGEYPMELIKKAHSLGLMNFFIPANYGGVGVNYCDGLLLQEEIAYGCTGVSIAMSLNGLAGSSVVAYGSERQKKEYLGRLASHPSVAAFGVTEPATGSDVAAISTRAERKSDREWIINGEKAWISNAGYADWHYVLARTDDKAKAGKAFTAFLVDRGTPGLSFGKKEPGLGQRCSDTRSLVLHDVRVSDDAVLGGVGNGFKITMSAFDYQRPFLAANATGLARRALDEAVKYAKERKAFGHPIADYQAIQFKLANMAIGIELARLAYLKAGSSYMRGEKITKLAAMAKCFAADVANQSASEAVQVFGGAGFNCDYPVEKLMRDAKIFQIYGGTSEIQRLIIARETIKTIGE